MNNGTESTPDDRARLVVRMAIRAFGDDVRAADWLLQSNDAFAPPPARAAIDFLHGLAAWDYAQAARAADPLLAAAAKDDVWLDPDQLRDGAVIAKLAIGDRVGARAAFRALISESARSTTDLRTRLLYSYIADTADARTLAAW